MPVTQKLQAWSLQSCQLRRCTSSRGAETRCRTLQQFSAHFLHCCLLFSDSAHLKATSACQVACENVSALSQGQRPDYGIVCIGFKQRSDGGGLGNS